MMWQSHSNRKIAMSIVFIVFLSYIDLDNSQGIKFVSGKSLNTWKSQVILMKTLKLIICIYLLLGIMLLHSKLDIAA